MKMLVEIKEEDITEKVVSINDIFYKKGVDGIASDDTALFQYISEYEL